MIMETEEHVAASPSRFLSFCLSQARDGLIKIRFTLGRESTKALLFPSTEKYGPRDGGGERTTVNAFFCPFVWFLPFSGRQRRAFTLRDDDDDEVEREARMEISTAYAKFMARPVARARARTIAPHLMHIQKLRRQ